MDQRLRELERRAAEGDPQAARALLRARLRAGELSRDGLRLAAYLDDAFAQEALDALGEEPPARSRNFSRWSRGLGRWGERVSGHALLALAALLPRGGVPGRSYIHDVWFADWLDEILPVARLYVDDPLQDPSLLQDLIDRFRRDYAPGDQARRQGDWDLSRTVHSHHPKALQFALASAFHGLTQRQAAQRVGLVSKILGRLVSPDEVERALRIALLPSALDPSFTIET